LEGRVVDSVGLPVGGASVTILYTLEDSIPGWNAVSKLPASASEDLPQAQFERLEVLDYMRRPVRLLMQTGSPRHETVWRGDDGSGNPAPNGFYYYRVTVRDASGFSILSERKMLMLEFTPEGLLKRKNALADRNGHYRIPMQLLAVGETITIADEANN